MRLVRAVRPSQADAAWNAAISSRLTCPALTTAVSANAVRNQTPTGLMSVSELRADGGFPAPPPGSRIPGRRLLAAGKDRDLAPAQDSRAGFFVASVLRTAFRRTLV